MKKQVLSLAAMVIASNVAVAGVSQSVGDSSQASAKGLRAVSAASVKVTAGASTLSAASVRTMVQALGASAASVSGSTKKGFEATSTASRSSGKALVGAAEFTVQSVSTVSAGSVKSVTVVLKGLGNSAASTWAFSFDTSKKLGKAMSEVASALFVVSKTVVVATATSGAVLVTDSSNGTKQILLDGKPKAGSSTIVASFSDSGKAFESTMVKGLTEKK